MKVNKRELADVLGVTQQTITNWDKDGMPVARRRKKTGEENEYDTAKVIEWYVGREVERAEDNSAKGRLDRIRAAREELGLYRDAGKLADVATVQAVLDKWLEAALAAMDGFEERAALAVHMAKDQEEQRAAMRAAVKEIREALADVDLAGAFAGAGSGSPGLELESGANDAHEVPAAA